MFIRPSHSSSAVKSVSRIPLGPIVMTLSDPPLPSQSHP